MGGSCTVITRELLVLELCTPAILATLSVEVVPGSVCLGGVGVGQLQLVKVSAIYTESVFQFQYQTFCVAVSTDPPPTTCSDLPLLTNGDITYNAGSTNNRPVNTVATHTCNNGYTFSGGSGSNRVCTITGIWSGATPTCVGELIMMSVSPHDVFSFVADPEPTDLHPTTCSDLPSLADGIINYNMGSPRPVGTIAVHTCNTGYTLSGDTTRTCESDEQWSGSVPECQSESAQTACYMYSHFTIYLQFTVSIFPLLTMAMLSTTVEQ